MVYCSNCGTRCDGRFCYKCGSTLHCDDAGAQTPATDLHATAAVPAHALLAGTSPADQTNGVEPAIAGPPRIVTPNGARPAIATAVVEPEPSGVSTWRKETRRAWLWWRRGFIWLAVLVTLEMFVALPSRVSSAADGIAYVVGGFVGLGVVLAIQYGLAYWLLASFERGSGIARRVFQIGFVLLACVRTLGAMLVFGSIVSVLDFIAGLGEIAMWGYAAYLVSHVGHTSTPRTVVREDGTVVRMRTEIPSFVATIVMLLITAAQFSADLVRGR